MKLRLVAELKCSKPTDQATSEASGVFRLDYWRPAAFAPFKAIALLLLVDRDPNAAAFGR